MTEENNTAEPIDLEHLYPFPYLVDHNRLCIQENVKRTLTKLLDEEELTLTDSRSHLKNVRIGKQMKRFIVVRKETMRRVTAMYLNLESDTVADAVASSVADETKTDAADSDEELPF